MNNPYPSLTLKTLRAVLLLAATGCAGELDSEPALLSAALQGSELVDQAGLGAPASIIGRRRYYSSFDGQHTYQVAFRPLLDQVFDHNGVDPIDPDSLVWSYDAAFIGLEFAPSIPGGVVATMRNAGVTTLQVHGSTESGQSVSDSTELEISAHESGLWAWGDNEFYRGDTALPRLPLSAACEELLPEVDPGQQSGPCQNCHSHTASIAIPLSEQISAFSDEALMQLISEGTVPEGYVHNAPFTKNLNRDVASCIMQQTHAWEMSDALQRALLLKVRSELPWYGVARP